MLKIRRSHNRLIFNVGIPIPGIDGLNIETGPWRWHGHQTARLAGKRKHFWGHSYCHTLAQLHHPWVTAVTANYQLGECQELIASCLFYWSYSFDQTVNWKTWLVWNHFICPILAAKNVNGKLWNNTRCHSIYVMELHFPDLATTNSGASRNSSALGRCGCDLTHMILWK